jgi:propanol-preferring alcohol dehydrogenase
MVMPCMHAMISEGPHKPLRLIEREIPILGKGEILIQVTACGVCRTDLHVVDGEIPAHYPVIPGHEIVGRVIAVGAGATRFSMGDRVGVPWLGHSCGQCSYCIRARENLCDFPQFTGATRDGGYATHALAEEEFCFHLPDRFTDLEAAPLLCAGLIGWRTLRLAGEGEDIGLYGFGAAAHILAQVCTLQGRRVYAVTRDNDVQGQQLALDLGCVWAGGSSQTPPKPLDAALIFAPVGELVPLALRSVRKGGKVVCAGIYMSDIPSFQYAALWGERQILSVANLTRADGESFFAAVARMPLRIMTETFPLIEANEALARLRAGRIAGAAVIQPVVQPQDCTGKAPSVCIGGSG